MTDDWRLPKPSALRTIVADEPDELTDMERAALAAHPWLRDGLVVEFLTADEINRLAFMQWRLEHGDG